MQPFFYLTGLSLLISLLLFADIMPSSRCSPPKNPALPAIPATPEGFHRQPQCLWPSLHQSGGKTPLRAAVANSVASIITIIQKNTPGIGGLSLCQLNCRYSKRKRLLLPAGINKKN